MSTSSFGLERFLVYEKRSMNGARSVSWTDPPIPIASICLSEAWRAASWSALATDWNTGIITVRIRSSNPATKRIIAAKNEKLNELRFVCRNTW